MLGRKRACGSTRHGPRGLVLVPTLAFSRPTALPVPAHHPSPASQHLSHRHCNPIPLNSWAHLDGDAQPPLRYCGSWSCCTEGAPHSSSTSRPRLWVHGWVRIKRRGDGRRAEVQAEQEANGLIVGGGRPAREIAGWPRPAGPGRVTQAHWLQGGQEGAVPAHTSTWA